MIPAVAALCLLPSQRPVEHLFYDGLLIGTRIDGKWQETSESNPKLATNTFQVVEFAPSAKQVRVNGFAYNQEHHCIYATNNFEESVVFNGKATWPRPVKEISTNNRTYRAVIRRLLDKRGVPDEVELTGAVSADLDGNGTQEVLLFAHLTKEERGYAIAVLRHVVKGRAVDEILEFNHYDPKKGGFPLWHLLEAVADFDGDGNMEFMESSHMIAHYDRGTLMRFRRGKVETVVTGAYMD